MKKLALVLVCVLASCFAVSAQNNAAYDALLDETVALSCNKTLMTEAFVGTFKSSLPEGMLSDAKCQAIGEEAMDLMYPIILNTTKDMWREQFNLDELKQIKAWLSSPTGQKLLNMSSKMGEIQQRLFQDPATMQKMTEIISKYVQ